MSEMTAMKTSSQVSVDQQIANARAAVDAPVAVPGYEFVEKLGSGGYGDVWRVIGPGGFPKALKVMFGRMDGQHAETELKALNRLRDVRHPFLLSIERVEVIDSRMIVVTELADCSLEMKFQEVTKAGGIGIEREELLAYLRDAADALDFMTNQHSLQHLDIKPDNLFLQGQHVKVGDFGLAKNIAATAASMINGFTPLYAPPELFEGRPSPASDQYSLAIVYQVMLTGKPPHNGRNAAQLTAQHLRSAPDLSPLPPSDRPVIARALSKNPAARFEGCRQLVDALSRKRPSGSVNRHSSSETVKCGSGNATEVVDPAMIGRNNSKQLRPAVPVPPDDSLLTDAPTRPTLMLGIGGQGCQIVHDLRQRLAPLLATQAIAPMRFMCVDTDSSNAAHFGNQSSVLASEIPDLCSLAIPLKSSLEYRKGARAYLNWLSRRWLFNIPRSGLVEGIRPLGRLAFVDHATTFRKRLTELFTELKEEFAVNADSSDSEFPVDVVLVGSTCGGTSSGSLLDAALTIRTIGSRLRMKALTTIGVLLHTTSGGGRQSDVQDANTICFLKELAHYSSRNCEPLRLHPDDSPTTPQLPFDDACFVHLGDDLTGASFARACAGVTDYLYRWLATPARRYIESWRTSRAAAGGNNAAMLRTFNIAAFESNTMKAAASAAGELTSHLLTRWLETVPTSNLSAAAQARFESWDGDLGVSDSDAFLARILHNDLAAVAESFSAEMELLLPSPTESASREVMQQLLDQTVASNEADSDANTSLKQVSDVIRSNLTRRREQAGQSACRLALEVLDTERRVDLAVSFLHLCRASVALAAKNIEQQSAQLHQTLGSLVAWNSQNASSALGQQGGAELVLRQFCSLLVAHVLCHEAAAMLKQLDGDLNTIVHNHVESIRTVIRRAKQQLFVSALRQPLPDSIVTTFDRYVQQAGRIRLSELAAPQSVGETLVTELKKAALDLLMDDLMQSQQSQEDAAPEGENAFPLSAAPILRNVGGNRRVLAMLPDGPAGDAWTARLDKAFGNCVQRCHSTDDRVEAICEVDGVTVNFAIEAIAHLKPQMANLARQVHTRNDINWG